MEGKKYIRDKIEGNLTLHSETVITGMIIGNVHLIENALVELNGFVIGDITIEKGCALILNGTVEGNVLNKGLCVIGGTLNGKVNDLGGKLEIKPQASIGNS